MAPDVVGKHRLAEASGLLTQDSRPGTEVGKEWLVRELKVAQRKL